MLKNATGYQAEERRNQVRRTLPRAESGVPRPGISGPEGRKHFDLLIHALGLAGEAGEVADYLKKVFGHGHPLDRDEAAEGARRRPSGISTRCSARTFGLSPKTRSPQANDAQAPRALPEAASPSPESLARKRPGGGARRSAGRS
jgi:hypothetical protein